MAVQPATVTIRGGHGVGLKAPVFEERVTRTGPNPRADQIAIRTTVTPTTMRTTGAEIRSASGPATRMGTRLAVLTSDARTPKTRPGLRHLDLWRVL